MSILLHLFENFKVAFHSSSLFIITIVIAFLFIMLFKWYMTRLNTKRKLPPSPPGLPFIGNLHQLGSLSHRSLLSMAKSHGNLMLLHFGRVPVFVASSADIAYKLMKTHDVIFANRPRTSIFKRLAYDNRDVAFSPYGEYWRQLKSIVVIHLLSNKKVKSFNSIRQEETSLVLDRVKKAANASSPVNLSKIFAVFSKDVVFRTVLGKKYEGQIGGRSMEEKLGELIELLGVFEIGYYVPWLKWVNLITGIDARVDKMAIEMDDLLNSIVEEHSAKSKGGSEENDVDYCESKLSMVDTLLRIQKENKLGFPLDIDSIKAMILDMFAAGTETTYVTMEWAMTELLRHPDCMKKLQKELREIAQGKTIILEKDLEGLKYLKAIIKETLRLHPPVPLLLMRESSRDVNVQGYDIAAGAQVIINAWAIGRDPCAWDKAEDFWPERFLNDSIDFRGQDFQFIPFGAGRRVCPGIQFATSEIEILMGNLLYKFDWSLCGGVAAEDLDMAETSGITTHRRHPLIVAPTSYMPAKF